MNGGTQGSWGEPTESTFHSSPSANLVGAGKAISTPYRAGLSRSFLSTRCGLGLERSWPMKYDHLILSSSVMSPHSPTPLGDAILVDNGKIVAIGPASDFYTTNIHKQTDLRGYHLYPGFVESHAHLWLMGHLQGQIDCGPPQNRKVQDILEQISRRAKDTPSGTWILGHHWDDTLLAEKRPPTLEELTRAAPHHPVYLLHNSAHLAVANQMALDFAGITVHSRIPGIMKDGSGKLRGELREWDALEAVSRHIPQPSADDMAKDIAIAVNLCLKQGVTSATDAALGLGDPKSIQTVWHAYQTRAESLKPFVRTQCYVRVTNPDTLIPDNPPTPFLSVAGVKLFADGSIQGHTAFLSQPYHDRPETQGIAVMDLNELVQTIKFYENQGLQLAIHANGDAAIDRVLKAYDTCFEGRYSPRRHRIEHAQMASKEQLAHMRQLGVLPNFFINHVYYWGDRHRDLFLGTDRSRSLNPLATARQLGLVFGLHSDAPITPVNPLQSLTTAVTRLTNSQQHLGSEQAISVQEAWQGYTTNAAYLGFRENQVGDLAVGLYADCVALSHNPLVQGVEALEDTKVVKTFIAGEEAFDAS